LRLCPTTRTPLSPSRTPLPNRQYDRAVGEDGQQHHERPDPFLRGSSDRQHPPTPRTSAEVTATPPLPLDRRVLPWRDGICDLATAPAAAQWTRGDGNVEQVVRRLVPTSRTISASKRYQLRRRRA